MSEPCLKCRTDIPTDAERCRACGFEPKASGHPYLIMAAGWLLTITGIGAIVGLPLIALASWHLYRRKDWKPTTANPA